MQTLTRLVKSGKSLSGRERHCCFLNIGSERFANISAISGLDFVDDGRAVAVVDWDHDGDLDLWIANRSGPQLRFMRNDVKTNNQYVSLRLEARQCNRDAIGARVEVVGKGEESDIPQSAIRNPQLIKTLRAGDGFISQSSKWLHFGLPRGFRIERVVVHWPGGDAEKFDHLHSGDRFRLVQGSGIAESLSLGNRVVNLKPSELVAPQESARLNTLLAARVPMTLVRYHDFDGNQVELKRNPGRPVLLNLWASWCEHCLTELGEFARRENELRASRLNIVALSVDGLGDSPSAKPARLSEQLGRLDFPFDAGVANERLVDKLELLYSTLFNRQVPFPVPASFLIDSQGQLANIYLGPVQVERLLRDVENLSADDQQRRRLAAPYSGQWYTPPQKVELQQIASVYALADYVEDSIPLYRSILQDESNSASAHNLLGISLFTQGDRENAEHCYREAEHHYREALRLNPELVDAQYNLGLVLSRLKQTREAIENFQAVLAVAPDYFDAHFNLGVILQSQGQLEDAILHYREAVRIQPRHLTVLRLLAVALIKLGQPDQAVGHFREAARLSPNDAQTLGDLGAALLQTGQKAEAVDHFRRALQLRPGWKSVMNNLAWTLATIAAPEVRDPAEAVRLAEQLTRGVSNPPYYMLDTLAGAYASASQYRKAVQIAEQAVQLAKREEVDAALLKQLQDRLRLYRQGQPYRQGK